jgi:hypothetical protein
MRMAISCDPENGGVFEPFDPEKAHDPAVVMGAPNPTD